ncbi:MAG: HAD family hydrolase [Verrucomicrobiae bacterium]|nr:HAD family hydrolase [Verrucomicrobiae bacterium]
MSRAAVFLDRDGTVIAERHYLKDPAQVELLPGAAAALKRLQDAGYLLFFVTNQSGIGRGYFSMDDALRVQARVEELLAGQGVRIIKTYVAPEAPDQPSRGRKPSPAFLWDARDEFQLDLGRSYMIGDKLIDLECGWNAGVRRSILVCTGYGQETAAREAARLRDAVVVPDLAAAAEWILQI